jgi:putative Mg2+ transporter-C (MgtC) family protein
MEYLTEDVMTSITRLSLIVLLSGLVGIEREMKNHPAGLRTHILVGVGSCLLMLVSLFGFESYLSEHPKLVGYDPSRIPSYVISGIGFLGAGTILVHGGVTVKGLTTAASIWVVAGLGLVVGIGMYFEAILTTVIIISTLFFLNKLENFYKGKAKNEGAFIICMLVRQESGNISEINKRLTKKGVEIIQYNMEEDDSLNSKQMFKYTLHVNCTNADKFSKILESIQNFSYVKKVQVLKK